MKTNTNTYPVIATIGVVEEEDVQGPIGYVTATVLQDMYFIETLHGIYRHQVVEYIAEHGGTDDMVDATDDGNVPWFDWICRECGLDTPLDDDWYMFPPLKIRERMLDALIRRWSGDPIDTAPIADDDKIAEYIYRASDSLQHLYEAAINAINAPNVKKWLIEEDAKQTVDAYITYLYTLAQRGPWRDYDWAVEQHFDPTVTCDHPFDEEE